jgi:hypothetical protein
VTYNHGCVGSTGWSTCGVEINIFFVLPIKSCACGLCRPPESGGSSTLEPTTSADWPSPTTAFCGELFFGRHTYSRPFLLCPCLSLTLFLHAVNSCDEGCLLSVYSPRSRRTPPPQGSLLAGEILILVGYPRSSHTGLLVPHLGAFNPGEDNLITPG